MPIDSYGLFKWYLCFIGIIGLFIFSLFHQMNLKKLKIYFIKHKIYSYIDSCNPDDEKGYDELYTSIREFYFKDGHYEDGEMYATLSKYYTYESARHGKRALIFRKLLSLIKKINKYYDLDPTTGFFFHKLDKSLSSKGMVDDSEMLETLHKDVVSITKKYKQEHKQVNISTIFGYAISLLSLFIGIYGFL